MVTEEDEFVLLVDSAPDTLPRTHMGVQDDLEEEDTDA